MLYGAHIHIVLRRLEDRRTRAARRWTDERRSPRGSLLLAHHRRYVCLCIRQNFRERGAPSMPSSLQGTSGWCGAARRALVGGGPWTARRHG